MVEKILFTWKKTAQFSATMVIKTIESTLKYICTNFPQSYRSFLIQRLINHVAIDLSVWRGIANTSPRNRVINSSYITSLHRDAAQHYYDRAQQFYGNFNIIIRFVTHWNIDWVYFRIYKNRLVCRWRYQSTIAAHIRWLL